MTFIPVAAGSPFWGACDGLIEPQETGPPLNTWLKASLSRLHLAAEVKRSQAGPSVGAGVLAEQHCAVVLGLDAEG
jgi:hypothetical protein